MTSSKQQNKLAPFILKRSNQPEGAEKRVRRLIPAALFSVLVHTFLIGLFFILLPSINETGNFEQKSEGAVNAEPIPEKDQFMTGILGLSGLEPVEPPPPMGIDPEPVPGQVIPGTKSPLEPSSPSLPLHGSGPGAGGGPGDFREGPPIHFGPGGGILSFTSRNGENGGGSRDRALQNGGTGESEAAVTNGLEWLAKQQNKDGSWSLQGKYPDKGNTENETAATGFGLLPFLGAGFTHKKIGNNRFNKPILDAILYLRRMQDQKTGNLDKNHNSMYAHGIATIALCEAYGMTQDPMLRMPAQRALSFIMNSQHEGGGWRYSPQQPGDLSVSGWMIMALKSGQMSGLDVSDVTMRKAQRFLDSSLSDIKKETYSYTPGSNEDGIRAATMTSVALLCRQYCQAWGPNNVRLIRGVENHIIPNPPGKNCYYYYYATQVMHHFGGKAWKDWNKVMRDQLVATQEQKQKELQGSWSSKGDAWGMQGGRLMVTSLNLLTLEVYYRHLPLYYREKEAAKDEGAKKAVGS